MGISLFPGDAADPQILLKNGNSAMTRAKERGGNGYEYYSPQMNARANRRLALENGLRRALERDELVLHYQPILDLESERIAGFEALVRWKHPELGLLPPLEFIPTAEETGLIVPLGEWVLRSACRQAKLLQQQGFSSIRMAVNISARQFARGALSSIVPDILRETGLLPESLDSS